MHADIVRISFAEEEVLGRVVGCELSNVDKRSSSQVRTQPSVKPQETVAANDLGEGIGDAGVPGNQ